MAGIKSLLKKKTWTGEEVGKLLFASLANDIKMQRGEADAPLLTTEEFDAIAGNLSYNPTQLHIYYAYHDAYKFVIEGFNRCSGLYQQFCHGYYRMSLTLHSCYRDNVLQKSLDRSPLIVTQSQYSRLKAKTIENLRSLSLSYINMFFDILDYFMRDDIKDVPDEIKTALEDAKKTSAKGSSYYNDYNKSFDYGYYELADGTKSDDLSEEEWWKALGLDGRVDVRSNLSRGVVKTNELFFKGPSYARQFVRETIGEEIDLSDEELERYLEPYAKNEFSSRKIKPISEALEVFVTGNRNTLTWRYYDTPPDDLSLFDVLPLYCDDGYDSKKVFKLLKDEAPQVFKSIKNYIESILPSVKSIKAAQHTKPCTTWGEMADLGCATYIYYTEPSELNIIETFYEDGPQGEAARRAGMSFNGIAILQNDSCSDLDEQGNYTRQTREFLNAYGSLGSSLDNKEKTSLLSCVKNISTSMKYLYCYNILIDMLVNVYGVKDIYVAKYDIDELEEKLRAYNSILYMTYASVYGNDEEKKRKRQSIKEAFKEIDYNAFKPSKEAVDRVRREMEELGTTDEARRNFQYFDIYVKKLLNEEV